MAEQGADVLGDLVRTLEKAISKQAAGKGDAIDAILNEPARVTQVRSLRDAPEVEAFRQELIDGLIRVDTANRLLGLVNELVTRLL